ncbi:two-component system sensor kinase FixL [Rhizomicrobium palustre]|uniref:histidine kinase n=1 Tax=Rhizomicrobium palustre TaxID=189966 RepID=A0A846N2Y8_9PROT|nr:PAS domain S-box protein [Rhizomicrobium palustre]NIK89845.1 two-component system sensor kinase FixL [Rhizomicrobium palustre]
MSLRPKRKAKHPSSYSFGSDRFGASFGSAYEEQTILLRSIFELSNDAIYTKSLDGIITSWNGAAEAMFGYSADEVIGLPMSILVPAECREEETAVREAIARGEVLRHYEAVRLRKDGSRFIASISGSPILDLNGNIVGISKILRDISEAKAAESALKLHADVFKLSFDAIILWRLDSTIEAWNSGAEMLYGFSEAEAVGRVTHDLLQTIHPIPWLKIRAALLEKGFWQGELRHRTRDGREVIVSARKQLMRGVDGIARVIETNRDVTEQKCSEEALRRSEERYRLLHDSMRDAFVQTSLDGKILDLNETYCQMLGYSAEELRAKTYQDLTPERWHAVDESQVTGAVLTRGYSDVYEKEYRRKDGSIIPVELRVNVATDVHGNPESLWAIVRDLSEKRHFSRNIDRMRTELAHVGRLSELGQVSAGIAHELNQPLAAMMNYSSLAKRLISSGGKKELVRAQSAISKAVGQAQRASEIIRRMRGFIEHRETKRKDESVNAIVEEALALGLIGTHGEGIAPILELAPDLPSVFVDRLQVQQVLVNLLRNAVEAMGESPRRELVLSTGRNSHGEVEVAVRDSGHGIPQETLRKLFMPFFTTKPGGMGIGLLISQSIVEAHGGQITVESEEGKGSVFRFTLPAGTA